MGLFKTIFMVIEFNIRTKHYQNSGYQNLNTTKKPSKSIKRKKN